jgi:dGTPase
LTYTDFRTALNREIVEYCAKQYIENHDQVNLGALPSLMATDSPSGHILNLLKEYCRSKVYCHESVQRVELAGYTAIYGLLDNFKCLLICSFERFSCSLDYAKNKDDSGRQIVVEKKLPTLFPKNYIKVYFDDLKLLDRKDEDFRFREWALRAHLVTDFLSGMTDDFAMSTYRTLSGMRL